jgi:hypothetical protein
MGAVSQDFVFALSVAGHVQIATAHAGGYSAVVSNINTELSLLGIKSADIVMTGGGPGASATPFAFSLENVVMS